MFAFYEKRSKDLSYSLSSNIGFSAHLHRHIEVVYMLEGKTDAMVDGENVEICTGDVFITFPNQIHQYQNDSLEKHLIFIFSPDILPNIKDIFKNFVPATSVVKNASENPKLLPLLRSIAEAYEANSPYSDIKINGYLLAFFGEIFPMMTLLPTKTTDFSLLKNILNYCAAHYTHELSLDMVAKDLHISKYYISHLLSEKLDTGFNDYINALRISDACRYLAEGENNVTEIALLVGFNTARTFNRAFLKQMELTPSEYKKKVLSQQS